MYHLSTQIELAESLEPIFSFFSNAGNLQLITPGWLHFKVLSPGDIELCEGTRIDYRLWLRGVPIRWRSEITLWDPPHRFVDEQIRGPYRSWIHDHRFQQQKGVTRVIDQVRYDHWGGKILNRLVVAPDLEKIFSFRKEKLEAIFQNPDLS